MIKRIYEPVEALKNVPIIIFEDKFSISDKERIAYLDKREKEKKKIIIILENKERISYSEFMILKFNEHLQNEKKYETYYMDFKPYNDNDTSPVIPKLAINRNSEGINILIYKIADKIIAISKTKDPNKRLKDTLLTPTKTPSSQYNRIYSQLRNMGNYLTIDSVAINSDFPFFDNITNLVKKVDKSISLGL